MAMIEHIIQDSGISHAGKLQHVQLFLSPNKLYQQAKRIALCLSCLL